jgi:acylphosphatase
MASKKVRAHVIVHGRVQGVFFRYETQRAATQRDVVGWVRNLPDGSVEAVFEGIEENVHSTLEWCKQGPPTAKVNKIDVSWFEPEEQYNRFEIRY